MTGDTPAKTLRRGWTTGACAAAAAKAASRALATGRFDDPVSIMLPRGEAPSFPLARTSLGEGCATASIIKDAGDDPDVTDGAEIVVTVAAAPSGTGIRFCAGPGVGTVTRPGLPIAVGEAAINPAPRAMIEAEIRDIAIKYNRSTDTIITISIPGGETLAKKTMNSRLGIKGGLSILGTTGVVIPYSCSAWIHSINSGIDVARACNLDQVVASTGRTSEAAVRRMVSLPEEAFIEMGDFVGGLLKYVRRHPVPRLTIAGGFAKIFKLSCGEMDLRAKRSPVDLEALSAMLGDLGADQRAIAAARTADSAAQVLQQSQADGVDLGDLVARRARNVALACLGGGTDVSVVVFDRGGELVGRTKGEVS